MSSLTQAEFQQLQHDILINDLSTNPLLTYDWRPNRNKSLDTTRKEIIRAINELLAKINIIDQSTNTISSENLRLVGDVFANPVLLGKLHSIGENVIEALHRLYTDISGDPSAPDDISDLGGTIKRAIRKVSNSVKRLEDLLIYTHYKEIVQVNEDGNLSLTYLPFNMSLSLNINGIVYEEKSEAYTLDIFDPKRVIWLLGGEGFELNNEDFTVVATYDMSYVENNIVDIEGFIQSAKGQVI